MLLSLCLITPIKLSSTTVYEAGKLSVCLSAFLYHRTNLPTFASISTGLTQNDSCIYWNMQDCVYYFTGMIVFQHQSAKASG